MFKKFLNDMGLVNWLVVAVAFQFDGSQTWTMFWIFLSWAMLLFVSLGILQVNKKKVGLVFDKTPPSIPKLILGNAIDIAFFLGAAHIITNDLPYNIIVLGLAVRLIVFIITVNKRFVKG